MMDSQSVLSITGWDCRPSGVRSVLAISPFTLGNDGQHAAFYLAQPDDSSFFITDAGQAAMHASAHGVDLPKARLDLLNATHGVSLAQIGVDGAITARGPIADAQEALWDAVKIAMSLSFNSRKWAPKLDQMRFRALVEKTLIETVGSMRILKSVKVQAMTGHTVEFPFAIKSANESLFYLEPIALSNEKIDWAHVYQVHGKLSDVKQADETMHRVVIFEDGAPAIEFGRAATLLAQSASIKTLTEARAWARSI
jgi:hypothetical protein